METAASQSGQVHESDYLPMGVRCQTRHIKRFKARLVIHCFKQQLGINYSETYAPIIRFESIRAAINNAVQIDWQVLQYDVNTAFLSGDLEELIFMEQLPGF
jgi:hypothetical protein